MITITKTKKNPKRMQRIFDSVLTAVSSAILFVVIPTCLIVWWNAIPFWLAISITAVLSLYAFIVISVLAFVYIYSKKNQVEPV